MSGAPDISGGSRPTVELDPFDLPDWLGVTEVTWSGCGRGGGHVVGGELTGSATDQRLDCDLLAVDQAFPVPVVDDAIRRRVHQSWRHGQVLLVCHASRTAVATPGTAYAPADVLETVARLARAVGADPAHWSVRLSLGPTR